jgi:hypothetical protein
MKKCKNCKFWKGNPEIDIVADCHGIQPIMSDDNFVVYLKCMKDEDCHIPNKFMSKI